MMEVAEFFNENIYMIYLLIFLGILGIELISNVSSILHTPLMSGANAISGIVIIGAILIIRQTDPSNTAQLILGIAALSLAMINVVGGFAVTDRMLDMFKKKKKDNAS